MDIETPGKGFLAKTLYEDGETNIPVTKPIAVIAKEKEDIEEIKKCVSTLNSRTKWLYLGYCLRTLYLRTKIK